MLDWYIIPTKVMKDGQENNSNTNTALKTMIVSQLKKQNTCLYVQAYSLVFVWLILMNSVERVLPRRVYPARTLILQCVVLGFLNICLIII